MGLRVVNKVYTDLEGRTGDSMQGNYLDKSIVQYDVEYDAKLCLSPTNSVIKKGNTFSLVSGSWFEEIGAFKGANIDFTFSGDDTPVTITTTVDYVDGTEMTLIDGGGSQDNNKSVGFFQITDAPELFEVDFNLVQNSVSGGTRFSLIDDETQRFSAIVVNSSGLGGIDNFIQLGKKSGGSEITATITGLAAVGGNSRWKILINYKNPLLFDEELYKADDCIGDYARIRATAQRGNDNVFVDIETKNIGDTGYENEALNGGVDEYTLTSIAWTDDSANVMDVMDYSQPSNFSIVIGGTFSGDIKYGVKLFRLPQDETEYKNKALNLERNLSLCMNDVLIADGVPTAVTGETNADGAAFDISGFDVTDNTTSITVVGKITPNAAMITLLGDRGETDKDYKLLIVVDDTTKAYRDANTVNVLCDASNAVKNTIPLGNWGGVADFDMIGSDGVVLTGTPALLIESDNRMNVTFTLPKNANFVNPWLSMTGQIVATRISTGERFIYKSEEYVYDISQLSAERPSKILLIDYEQTKGRKLPLASEFNDVTFELNPFLDTGSDFGCQLNYSFQVGYQDWIDVPEISNYFEGDKNNNWYNISNDADWGLAFEFVLEHEDGTYTDSKPFTVINYGAWTGAIVKTYVDADSNVVTRPLANQTNTLTAVATGLNPFTGNEYAVISIRDKDGVTLGQIATDIDPVTGGNPLQPIIGQTRLKITVLSNVATLVCLIDTNLINVKEYTIVIDFNADV